MMTISTETIWILSAVAGLALLQLIFFLCRGKRKEQEDLLDSVQDSLAEARRDEEQRVSALRIEVENALSSVAERMDRVSAIQNQTISSQLGQVRTDNAQQLEKVRQTVDEKLQGTLEKRLGESFSIVGKRLDDVAKGLGEMQKLASDVGDLQRVLTNVKVRGTWGEYQLGNLLAELLQKDQFAAQVKVQPRAHEMVDYAVRLPGREGETVWLPIDCKFPREDYERLQEFAEAADKEGVERSRKTLRDRILLFAKDISSKYLLPPYTTNFGLLFLPTEGLYAEVIRIPGLSDEIQRKYRICLVGPTTLAAFLNSLQMGFRTLAIEKRSGEVWRVLADVKSEFQKFESMFSRLQKKVDELDQVLQEAGTRTRAMNRKLRDVQLLDSEENKENSTPSDSDLDKNH